MSPAPDFIDEIRVGLQREDEPIPYFTEAHVRAAVARMKAYAQSHPDLHASLSEKTWENLARVALDMRPHA